MNFSIKLSILFFLSVIIYSCSSDDNSTNSSVEPTNDFAELNGTWTGETRILQAGDCISINKNWTPVELDILVDETGKVLLILSSLKKDKTCILLYRAALLKVFAAPTPINKQTSGFINAVKPKKVDHPLLKSKLLGRSFEVSIGR